MAWSCLFTPGPTSWWSTMQRAVQYTMLMAAATPTLQPLIITREEIDRGIKIFEDAIKGMRI